MDEHLALLDKYQTVFGTRQTVTKLSKLPPMKAKRKAGSKPCCGKPRVQLRTKMVQMRKKLLDLRRIGMILSDDDPVLLILRYVSFFRQGNDWSSSQSDSLLFL